MKLTAALLALVWLSSGIRIAGQSAGSTPSLTGDPAVDQWVRTTFGQAIEPEPISHPVWGSKTLLALTDAQREGARLFRQRCNVCHGAAMNSSVTYGPQLSRT